MNQDLTSAPNPDAVDAQSGQGAQHRRLLQDANAALAASPAQAVLDSVQIIHRIVLGADPKALSRSVGWFGRLFAKDITLQAESLGLRSQLGVHVLQARQHFHALIDSDRQLEAIGLAVQTQIDELGRPSTPSSDSSAVSVPDDEARHLQYRATLVASLKITATHLDLTLQSHRQLRERVEQILPQLEILLDQQRMLHAGLTEQTALQSAARAMKTLHDLGPLSVPDDNRDPSIPKDATPR